jgi:beta-lactamase superfamily II metal-dependent hydrolase
MAAAPKAVTVRMYNVGFGDCFLLTFQYASGARHMLVDYGSTSAPKSGPKKPNYMERVANDIKSVCGGKLDVLVATHRHRDHVSGFSTDVATGKMIAALQPDHVIQPWTEDPRARTDALTATASVYTAGKPDPQKMTAHFLGSLEDMHAIAATIKHLAGAEDLAGKLTREQLQFFGEDNIKNPAAVRNLVQMGQRGKAHYVNAGMALNVLPGVKCTVLGPPTLRQSDTIRKQRARDPANFWQFRSFWGSQSLALRQLPGRTNTASRRKPADLPPSVRWFVNQSRQIHVAQLLSIVRDLDSVMNNTSVILLLEIGNQKILLPGDAQIENWAYALSKPAWRKLLADVSLYKVGHHGSLNATPKPLWELFKSKGGPRKENRLATLCSTKAGKHGSVASGTEVPRRTLVDELERNSTFTSSEAAEDSFCNQVTLEC